MQEEPKVVDPFLYRLIGATSAGAAFILVACGCYLAFQRIPLAKDILVDFGTKVPAVTSMVLAAPWFSPVVVPLLALVAGILSVIHVRRWLLATTCALILVSLAVLLLTWYAIELPMVRLLVSVPGS